MRYIIIEDAIYRVTTLQLKQLDKVRNDEMALAKCIEENRKHYEFVGYVELQFRE